MRPTGLFDVPDHPARLSAPADPLEALEAPPHLWPQQDSPMETAPDRRHEDPSPIQLYTNRRDQLRNNDD